MIVNGKQVFVIQQYPDILVEQKIKGLLIPNQVPVYLNFDYSSVIGIATLRLDTHKVYADISLFVAMEGYPAIAYQQQDKKVFALAISGTPNKDRKIKRI